jgi:ABC-type transport system involved in multi-copper enzyme maturation permease subunit
MSLLRVWVIATNVFKEVIRDRVLYLVAVYAVALVALATLLPEIAAGAHGKITLDLGLAGIHLLGLIVTVFVGTGLINKEIEKRTVLVLIAKPVSRVEFIVGKHLGLVAVLAVLTALLTVIYFAVLTFKGIAFSPQSLLIAIFFNFLEMALLTAVALLFGVFTSSLLATLLTPGIYLMGHLSQDIVALGKLTENSTFQRVANGLYLVLPDLERLNLRNEAVYGMAVLPALPELLSHIAYAVLYMAVLLILTVGVFARRQF